MTSRPDTARADTHDLDDDLRAEAVSELMRRCDELDAGTTATISLRDAMAQARATARRRNR